MRVYQLGVRRRIALPSEGSVLSLAFDFSGPGIEVISLGPAGHEVGAGVAFVRLADAAAAKERLIAMGYDAAVYAVELEEVPT